MLESDRRRGMSAKRRGGRQHQPLIKSGNKPCHTLQPNNSNEVIPFHLGIYLWRVFLSEVHASYSRVRRILPHRLITWDEPGFINMNHNACCRIWDGRHPSNPLCVRLWRSCWATSYHCHKCKGLRCAKKKRQWPVFRRMRRGRMPEGFALLQQASHPFMMTHTIKPFQPLIYGRLRSTMSTAQTR